MDNTPTSDTSQEPDQKLRSIFISFTYSGSQNGVPQQGFDSRVLLAPADTLISSAEDIKALADALAKAEFDGERRFSGLEITPLYIQGLPI